MRQNPYKTINTFNRKPCFNQIASYTIIIAQQISFYGFVQTYLENYMFKFILVALFLITSVVVIISTCIASYKDPSDTIMINYRNRKQQKKQGLQMKSVLSLLFCPYCDSYVSEISKHCKICDRCVYKFDHHCIWINNCIGKTNYRSFLIMIISTFLNLSIYLIGVFYLWYQGNWPRFLSAMIFNWIIAFIVTPLSLLILSLIILHLYLIKIGMTTFDYIYQKKQVQTKKIRSQIQIIEQNAQQRQRAVQDDVKNEKIIKIQKINTQQQINRTNEQINISMNHQNRQKTKAIRQNDPSIQQKPYDKNQFVKKNKLQSQFRQQCQMQQFENFDEVYKNHRSLKLLVGKNIMVRRNKGIPRTYSQINEKPPIKQNENQQRMVKQELQQ